MILLLIFILINIVILLFSLYKHKSAPIHIAMFSFLFVALLGLSFYSEIVSAAKNSDTPFVISSNPFSRRILIQYTKKLPIILRMINIGVFGYCFTAIIQPFVIRQNVKLKVWMIFFFFLFALLIIFFDPEVIKKISINTKISGTGIFEMINQNAIIIYLGSLVIKFSMALSIILLIIQFKRMIPMVRSKNAYLLITLVPIHLSFIFLFLNFPTHVLFAPRIAFLSHLYLQNGILLYTILEIIMTLSFTAIGFFVLYPKGFFILVRRNRFDFKSHMHTAYSGLKIFSHSVKNQFITINLLIDHWSSLNKNVVSNNEPLDQVKNICITTITRLSRLSKRLSELKLDYQIIDIITSLKSIISNFASNKKKIYFDSKESVAYAFIDQYFFKDVIKNIIINAEESSVDKVTIRISVKKHHMYYQIDLHDNGPGFEKKTLKKIFDPFYSTKPSIKSWGLGLSYCRYIIEAFGGTITASNTGEGGGLMRILIPIIEGKK